MDQPNLAERAPAAGQQRWQSRVVANLGLISTLLGVVFSLIVLFYGVPAIKREYSKPRVQAGDFHYLLAAGKLATSSDAHLLYGPGPADYTQWQKQHGYQYPDVYPYAPAGAYATGALTVFSDATALDVWRGLTALGTAVLALAVAASFRSWAWRLATVAAVACWDPILLNARIGQAGVFVAALTAVAAVVFLRWRLAGAVLFGLLAIKPTAAIGPAFIALPERVRVWQTFLGTAAVSALLPFLWLGPTPFRRWLDVLSTRGSANLHGTESYNQGITSLIGRTEFVAVLLFGLLIATALVAEKVHARLGLCGGAAFALFAGCLLNPHSLLYDWGVAFVGVLFLRKANMVREDIADLAIGGVMVSLFVVGQLAWTLQLHDYVLRPLTGWAILATGALLLLAWLRPEAPVEPSADAAAVPDEASLELPASQAEV